MTYVEQLLGQQGQANRLLGKEILQQRYLEAIHTAAYQPRRSVNIYGSTCPFCCGDVDDAASLNTGAAGCQFCRNREPAAEQSRSRWPSLELASTVVSRFGQGQAQRAPE